MIADGAPVVRRGRRGRGGCTTLVDVAQLTAWRCRISDERDAVLEALADDVPQIIAAAVHAAFADLDAPWKRSAAGLLAGVGYRVIVAVLDRVRKDAPNVPELAELPPEIERLCRVFRDASNIR